MTNSRILTDGETLNNQRMVFKISDGCIISVPAIGGSPFCAILVLVHPGQIAVTLIPYVDSSL